jgi:iduronate 2-sulfatase
MKIFHNWHTQEEGDARSWSALEFLHYATHGDDGPQVSGPVPRNHATGGPRKYLNVEMRCARTFPGQRIEMTNTS